MLTVRPLPYSGESTIGYLHRLIIRNGVSQVDRLAAAANDSCYLPEGCWIRLLESITGHPLSQLDLLPLQKVGVGAASKYYLSGIPLHRKHIVKGLNVCPQCLREQAFHRASWQLIWMPLCEVHKCPLVACGPDVDSAMLIKALENRLHSPCRRWTDRLSPTQLKHVIDIQRSLMQGILSWEQDFGFHYSQACDYVDRLIDRMHTPYAGPRAGAPIQRSTETPERVIECMLEASL